jgi:hypothetical protein
MKILVIYCTNKISNSLRFFIKNGYYLSDDTDFYICINNPTLDISSIVTPKENLFIVNRENKGLDFGGWSYVLLKDNLYLKYDYFIFVNDSCTGPFLPVYVKDRWTDIIINQLDDKVKIVGATINHHYGKPHVQSYFFCLDKISLNIAISNVIFSEKIINTECNDLATKWQIIIDHEIKLSLVIIDSGYKIKSFMKAFENIDFSSKKGINMFKINSGIVKDDMTHNNLYFGISIHPYEVMFFKSNRKISQNILDKYYEFHMNQ